MTTIRADALNESAKTQHTGEIMSENPVKQSTVRFKVHTIKVDPKTGAVKSGGAVITRGGLNFHEDEEPNQSYIIIFNPVNENCMVEGVTLWFETKEELKAFLCDHLKQFEILLTEQNNSTPGIHVKIMHTLEQNKNDLCSKCRDNCIYEDECFCFCHSLTLNVKSKAIAGEYNEI